MLDKSKLEVQTRNMEAALSLTFQMLKILPPLVVCQPWKYHEALQDTNRVAWDEEKEQEAELIYYRPVLVYGNRLHVAVKGLVGNKKNSGEKFDKGSQTTLQDSQHGDSDISGQEEGALNNTCHTNGLPEEAKGVPDKETPTLEANDLPEEAETPTVEAKGVSDKETPMVEANGLLEEETLTLEANEEETPAVEANGLPTPTLEAKGVPDKETPTLEANGLTALTQEDNPSTEENASTQEVNVSDEKKMPEIFNEMEKECSTQKKASSSTQEEGISGNSSTQVAASNEKTSKTELMSNTSAQKKSIQHNSIQDDSIQKVTGTQKIVSDYPTQNDGSTEV